MVLRKTFLSVFVLQFFLLIGFGQEIEPITCSFNDQGVEEALNSLKRNRSLRRFKDGTIYECPIAISVDYETYDYYDKNEDLVKNRVYEFVKKASEIFLRDAGVKLTLSDIHIFKEYKAGQSYTDYWDGVSQDSIPRRIIHTFRRVNIGVGGFAVGNFYTGYESASITGSSIATGRAIKTFCHEIAHNFGAPHTHDMRWPNGPLDACGAIEPENLSTGLIGGEDRVGTILSYCTGVRNALEFRKEVSDLLRASAIEHLNPITEKPKTPVLLSKIEVSSSTPFLYWKAVPGTFNYHLQISSDSNFSQAEIDTTVSYSQFQAFGLENGVKYFRIRSTNDIGVSEWSNIAEIAFDGNLSLSVPVFWSETKMFDRYVKDLSLHVQGNSSVEFYEVNYRDTWAKDFGHGKTIKSNSPNIKISDEFSGLDEVHLVVRAKYPEGYSDWSRELFLTRPNTVYRQYSQEKIPYINKKGFVHYRPLQLDSDYEMSLKIHDIDFEDVLVYDTTMKFYSGEDFQNYGVSFPFVLPEANKNYRVEIQDQSGTVVYDMPLGTVSENEAWVSFSGVDERSNLGTKVNEVWFDGDHNKVAISANGFRYTDGVNWSEKVGLSSSNGFVSDDIRQTLKRGEFYWYRNYRDVSFFDGESWKIYNNKNSPLGQIIEKMGVDGEGGLLVETSSLSTFGYKLFYLKDNSWKELTNPNNGNYISFFQFGEDIVYLKDGNPFKFNGNSWDLISLNIQGNPQIKGLKKDHKGRIVVKTTENIWYRITETSDWVKRRHYFGDDLTFWTVAFDSKDKLYFTQLVKPNLYVTFKENDEAFDDIDYKTFPFNYADASDRIISSFIDDNDRMWYVLRNGEVHIRYLNEQLKTQYISAGSFPELLNPNDVLVLNPTASSDLPVSLELVSGNAIIDGMSISSKGQESEVELRLSQKGNAEYEPAKDIYITFSFIAKSPQEITYENISSNVTVGEFLELNPVSSSDLPVSIKVLTGNAEAEGTGILTQDHGLLKFILYQSGDDTFKESYSDTISVCVLPSRPSITQSISKEGIKLQVDGSGHYTWYFDGEIINQDTYEILSPEIGEYQVEALNNSPSCPSSLSEVFVYQILSRQEKPTAVILFPNPAKEVLNVSGIGEKVYYSIEEVNGKKVSSGQAIKGKIDITKLPGGLYILKVYSNNRNDVEIFRWVKI